MGELTEEQRAKFGQIIGQANQVAGLLAHPGMAVVRKAIENLTEFNRQKWYAAKDAEEAELIRRKTAGFEEFFKVCEVITKNGEVAKKQLAADNAPSEQSEQGA